MVGSSPSHDRSEIPGGHGGPRRAAGTDTTSGVDTTTGTDTAAGTEQVAGSGSGGGREVAGANAGPLSDLVRAAAGSDPSRAFWAGLVVGTVLVVATVLLIVQNGTSTRFHWSVLSFDAPLWLLLLVSVVAGICLGALGVVLWRHRQARTGERRVARRRLRELAKRQPDVMPPPRTPAA